MGRPRRLHRSRPSGASLGEWVSRNLGKGGELVGARRRREWSEGDAKRQAVDITADRCHPRAPQRRSRPRPAGPGPAGPAGDDEIPF